MTTSNLKKSVVENEKGSAANAAVRILGADDHLVYRLGIRNLLATEPGFEVVGEASDGVQTIELYRRLQPDVLLLDLRMPQKGGIDVVRAIRAHTAQARILIVTSYQTEEEVFQVMQAGALGYILKDMGREALIDAIHHVHAGRRWVSSTVRQHLEDRAERPQLTAREMEVMRLLARGLTNSEIAGVFGISTSTVKNHVNNLLTKLDVSDRTEAGSFCLSRGMIHPEDL